MNTLSFPRILTIVALILIVPLVANFLVPGFNWDIFDFVVAAVLLIGTGLLISLVLRKVQRQDYRLMLFALIVLVLFLVWAELAVGIFGSPFAGS